MNKRQRGRLMQRGEPPRVGPSTRPHSDANPARYILALRAQTRQQRPPTTHARAYSDPLGASGEAEGKPEETRRSGRRLG